MSIIQTMNEDVLSDYDTCPGCGAALPHGAVFCASCGKRLDREKGVTSLAQVEQDISARYRVISLIRRRPSVNLYLALDVQPAAHGHMVAIRAIDIASLDEQTRLNVIEQAQQEYDLLRRWQLPYVLPAIDLRYAQGHLYTVAGFAPQTPPRDSVATPLVGVPSPFPSDEESPDETPTRGVATESTRRDSTRASAERETQGNWPRLTTLQDFLQSGQGLPSEQRTLQMMSYLCAAVDGLHHHQVIIGDLDPSTVILNGTTVDAQPGLMISWLLPRTRALLSSKPTAPILSYFIAPEAVQNEGDARSDIYSLGAIFYLLLTGMPPEESTLRQYKHLRTPHEINPRMSLHISESVMQALAVEPNERFSTVAAFSEALRNPRYRRPAPLREAQSEQSPEVETVRILPLSYKDLARWRAGRAKKLPSAPIAVPSQLVETVENSEKQSRAMETNSAVDEVPTVQVNPGKLPRFYSTPVNANTVPVTPDIDSNGQKATGQAQEELENKPSADSWMWEASPSPAPTGASNHVEPPAIASRSWKQRITGILPALNPRKFVGTRFSASVPHLTSTRIGASASAPLATPIPKKSLDVNSLFEQIKQAVLGEQQHVIAAAAIIETPLRVLPDQQYTIRLNVMGRDQVEPSTEKRQGAGGLSGLMHGDVALVEVRSVLQESYAYVVQMATVTIPAEGYVAEVTIPMQPLSSTPTGRRDRLHIFLLNEQRHPLYEKPFVLEIFVSHHVKRGSEGHHVLTIPV